MMPTRHRRYATSGAPTCPVRAIHGPMLRLPTGRWLCAHQEHYRVDPAHPWEPVKILSYTDAEVGLA